jgi:hypothetical protein
VKHDNGLGPKFMDLGTISAESIDEAEYLANQKASEVFTNDKIKWVARIRPVI